MESLKSPNPLLQGMFNYVHKNKGKQIRPMFSLLSARLGGTVNEKSYRAALVVELLHTASLVHDDVVDDSMVRRGDFSVNALWRSKPAVLGGDILSLNALLVTLVHNDHRILQIYTGAIGQIIEGEILQLQKSLKLNQDEGVYFEIIKAKTAAFFAAACAAGASSTFGDEDQVQRIYNFGEKVGIAFQIKDDLLDYSLSDIGKPRGHDIEDKKITLPLIYTLNRCSWLLKKKIIRKIRKGKDENAVKFVVEEVIKAGGIQYARDKMFQYRDDAISILNSFPESPAR
ncbi:MAG TPA: polyprenyl synthetase family protein, partial [Bacteroidales bacterium]|nr:polyprenyl synthetase family protein [Bacteroidales bacterium]